MIVDCIVCTGQVPQIFRPSANNELVIQRGIETWRNVPDIQPRHKAVELYHN
jgi:hypothetical protein